MTPSLAGVLVGTAVFAGRILSFALGVAWGLRKAGLLIGLAVAEVLISLNLKVRP